MLVFDELKLLIYRKAEGVGYYADVQKFSTAIFGFRSFGRHRKVCETMLGFGRFQFSAVFANSYGSAVG
jgi:hypothetical protein